MRFGGDIPDGEENPFSNFRVLLFGWGWRVGWGLSLKDPGNFFSEGAKTEPEKKGTEWEENKVQSLLEKSSN